MESTMKAAVVTAFNQPLEIQEAAIPKVSAGKVLVKVIATGVCHTDLHAMHGDWPIKPTVPFIPGHEGVGEVIEIGEGISHLKVGDKVGIPWLYSACGHCDHCYAGWETLCKEQQNSGYSVNGSFAEYCLADGDYVGVIPEGVDLLEIAPILCAGVTVYKGLKMTEAKTGNWPNRCSVGARFSITGCSLITSSKMSQTTGVPDSTSFLAALMVVAMPMASRRAKMKGLNNSSAISLGRPH